jgi:hypothetical protein
MATIGAVALGTIGAVASFALAGPSDGETRPLTPAAVSSASPTPSASDDARAGAGSVDDRGGASASVVSRSADPTTAPTAGEDISGPCDEAEHASDPRCTGAASANRDDDDADDADDRSGPNRGSDDGDDRSGPNRGSDAGDDSNRGSDDD